MSYCHIESYNHNHRIGVLAEFWVSDEFTSNLPEFKTLAHQVALHVAAMNPPDLATLLSQPLAQAPEASVGEHLMQLSRDLRSRIERFVRWDGGHPRTAPVEPEPPRSPAMILRFPERH